MSKKLSHAFIVGFVFRRARLIWKQEIKTTRLADGFI